MKSIHLTLIFAVMCLILYLYFSIIPCTQDKSNNNDNNDVENFKDIEQIDELPSQIKDLIGDRLELLKEQTIKSNNLTTHIKNCLGDIARCRDKINAMVIENSVSNTNGTTTIKEIQVESP
jgi:hypothetical protein